jgi:hypothetical protein
MSALFLKLARRKERNEAVTVPVQYVSSLCSRFPCRICPFHCLHPYLFKSLMCYRSISTLQWIPRWSQRETRPRLRRTQLPTVQQENANYLTMTTPKAKQCILEGLLDLAYSRPVHITMHMRLLQLALSSSERASVCIQQSFRSYMERKQTWRGASLLIQNT